jgi:hypothetical protein
MGSLPVHDSRQNKLVVVLQYHFQLFPVIIKCFFSILDALMDKDINCEGPQSDSGFGLMSTNLVRGVGVRGWDL